MMEPAYSHVSCTFRLRGDGVKSYEDINECKEKKACQCPECNYKNAWGSYDCICSEDLLYIKEHNTCFGDDEVELVEAEDEAMACDEKGFNVEMKPITQSKQNDKLYTAEGREEAEGILDLTMRALHQADSAALRIAASTWHHDLAPLPMPLLVFNIFGSYISFEEFKLLIFSPLWQYDMKLLAVDIPTATGPEQRLFLIGDEQEYKIGGGLISELRDPLVEAMPAEKDFEDLDQQEEEEDEVRELEMAETIRKEEEAEREQLELESLRKGGSS